MPNAPLWRFRMRPATVLGAALWLAALMSCSGRMVHLVAAGHPGWVAALAIVGLLVPGVRSGIRIPASGYRAVPDPLTQDLRAMARVIETVMADAWVRGHEITIALAPLVSPEGRERDYRVRLHTGPHAARRARGRTPRMPCVRIALPGRLEGCAPAEFTVTAPRDVRLRMIPDATVSGTPRLVHDAPPDAPRGLAAARIDRVLALGLLCWNLGRHGPYAAANPTLPAWCAGIALLAIASTIRHSARTVTTPES